jgi:predicted lipoprotein with Yx(FWY)xxD motif
MVELERFAALVAAKEREACAQVCANEEALALYNFDNDLEANRPFWNGGSQIATICEASIRARSKP